jgi:hypothetical protein
MDQGGVGVIVAVGGTGKVGVFVGIGVLVGGGGSVVFVGMEVGGAVVLDGVEVGYA